MLSVSQNAESRPASAASDSAIPSMSRAAPVISVAMSGWKKGPGSSLFFVFHFQAGSTWPKAESLFGRIQLGRVDLDKDAVARRIRENLGGQLLRLEPSSTAFWRGVPSRLDLRPDVYELPIEVVREGVDKRATGGLRRGSASSFPAALAGSNEIALAIRGARPLAAWRRSRLQECTKGSDRL